jgi:hypothetical protein
VGEVVRFRFVADDWACSRDGGRCRSYLLTAPSDGELEVVVTSLEQSVHHPHIDLYIVPGADEWIVGPGVSISAKARVTVGSTYEIRMYSSRVPSEELELRTSLR